MLITIIYHKLYLGFELGSPISFSVSINALPQEHFDFLSRNPYILPSCHNCFSQIAQIYLPHLLTHKNVSYFNSTMANRSCKVIFILFYLLETIYT